MVRSGKYVIKNYLLRTVMSVTDNAQKTFSWKCDSGHSGRARRLVF